MREREVSPEHATVAAGGVQNHNTTDSPLEIALSCTSEKHGLIGTKPVDTRYLACLPCNAYTGTKEIKREIYSFKACTVLGPHIGMFALVA